jgi:hypothetical protein
MKSYDPEFDYSANNRYDCGDQYDSNFPAVTDHDEVVDRARAIFARRYSDVKPEQGCIYWAAAFQEAAAEFDIKSLVVAGSAQFQFRADTDGVSNTHFSYMFDSMEAVTRMSQGLPPEFHAWNVLENGEMVDLTTGFQAKQANDLLGYVWEKEFTLPDYFWGKPEYPKMVYRADSTATRFVALKIYEKEKQKTS